MNNPKELQGRFVWLNAFFRSYYSFKELAAICDRLDQPHGDLRPFTHLHNVLLYDTVISWCKIFGSNSEDCHWKHVVRDHDQFRKYLFDHLGIRKEEFSNYHASVIEFRNKWVVHYDPKYTHNVVPELEIAHESSKTLHSYLREFSHEGIQYDGPTSIVEFGKNVAHVMISKLNATASIRV